MTAVIERVAASRRVRWAILWLPVGAWMVHLVFSASMVQLTCSHPEWRWTLYAITPITAAPCFVCLLLGLAVQRHANGDTPDDVAETLHLLGYLAVLISITNIVLIGAEGAVVPLLSGCG